MTDLNDVILNRPDAVLTAATDVNDRGMILCHGGLQTDHPLAFSPRAFLLIPQLELKQPFRVPSQLHDRPWEFPPAPPAWLPQAGSVIPDQSRRRTDGARTEGTAE
jgi:hypothetical protein